MTLDSSYSLLVRLFTLAFLVLVPPTALVSLGALSDFEQGMIPELDRKAAAVGRDVAGQVERAVGLGIPLDRLVGMEEFLAPLLSANPEIRYLAVTDDLGRVLFLNGAERSVLEPYYRTADFDIEAEGRKAVIDDYVDLALPVIVHETRVGQVHVGFGQNYVHDQLFEILIDVGVVVAVLLIVAFEILLFVVFFNITGPMKLISHVMDQARRGDFSRTLTVASQDEVGQFMRALNVAIRQADELYRRLIAYVDEVKSAHFDKGVVERVATVEARVRFLFRFSPSGAPVPYNESRGTDIRLPLFLFVFAEELSRSFMPLFIGGLLRPVPALTPEMVTAIPIAVFMLCIAVATPFGGLLTERLGARRVFMIGLVPAVLGYVMTAMAQSVFDLVLWRAATGVGYAMVTMACQGYISKSVLDSQGGAKGLGVFVGAVLLASVCGTAIGGILADRFGFAATFFVSAGLAMLAGVLVNRLLVSVVHDSPDRREPTKGEMLRLFRNWRFAFLVLFAAIPAKMALTGFMFFLAPLLLWDSGYGVTEIARIMVMYPLAVVVLTPLAARLCDGLGWRAGLVALGGLIGGTGLVLPALLPGTLPVVAAPVIVAIIALGVAHGLSASPQLAMIPDVCWTECRSIGRTNVLAFVRLAERMGSVMGPLLAAAFIPLWGLNGAMLGLGVVVLGMAGIFAMVSGAYGNGPHIQAEEAA